MRAVGAAAREDVGPDAASGGSGRIGGVGVRVVALLERTPVPGLLLAAVSLWLAARDHPSDIHSYRRWINGPLPSWEVPGPYPVGVSLVWWPLRWYHGGTPNVVWAFGWTVPATVLICLVLWRTASRPMLAVNVMLIAAAALERTWWLRLEPLAALVGLLAVLAARRARPATVGGLLSLGALVKVWPAFLLPSVLLLMPVRSWWRTVVAFALPWIAFAAVVAALDPPSAWTWFTFAFTRRIQLESLTALVPLWLLVFGSTTWQTIFRGGLDQANLLAGPHLRSTHEALELAGLAVLAVVAWRLLRVLPQLRDEDPRSPRRLLVAVCTQVVVLVVLMFSGPVFSPQYLGWYVPALVFAAGEGLLLRECALWVLACLLTAVEFPYLWDEITDPTWYGVGVLTLRDLTLAVVLVLCGRRLWRLTARR